MKIKRLFFFITGVIVLVAFVVSLHYVYYAMFATFQPYDDEGYMLIALSEYNEGKILYEELFTEYGPFYFFYHSALSSLIGYPINHDNIRLVTAAHWAIVALLGSGFVWRLTRSLPLSFGTYLLLVEHLNALKNEAGHPHSLLILLIMASLFASSHLHSIKRKAFLSLAMGGMAAAAILIKANVGLFLFLPPLYCFLFFYPVSKTRSAGLCGVTTVLILLPTLLMGTKMVGNAWVIRYCVATSVGLIGLHLICSRSEKGPPLSPLLLKMFGCGVLIVSVITVGYAILLGTSPWTLFHVLFLRPFDFPGSFSIPLQFPTIVLLVAGVASVLGIYFHGALSILRIFAALSILLASQQWLYQSWIVGLAPLTWLVVYPSSKSRSEGIPRLILGLLCLTQTLVAYPVAGTGRSLATFLFVPLAAVLLFDVISEFRNNRQTDWLTPLLCITVALIIGLCSTYKTHQLNYGWGISPKFPGTRRVRLTYNKFALYSWLINNLRSAGTFVSIPGLNSLYFWTLKRPPTARNAGHWFTLLTSKEQQEVVRALEQKDNVLVLQNSAMTSRWLRGHELSPKPLVRYIQTQFKSYASNGEYSLLRRKEKSNDISMNYLLYGQRTFSDGDDWIAFPKGLVNLATSQTLSMWFRTEGSGELLSLRSKMAWGEHSVPDFLVCSIGNTGSLVCIISRTSAAQIQSKKRVDDGRWHNLVITSQNSNIRLYVDNKELGTLRLSREISELEHGQLATSTHPAGTRVSESPPFRGEMADAFVISRVLTKKELTSLFAKTQNIVSKYTRSIQNGY